MRRTFSTFLMGIIATAGISQTAPNFTCNDCKGNPHDFYTELDAGKVIVICWVMPCGACVSPTLTTYNVVESYQASHPDKVYMYLADDFANTNCTSLNSWAAGYNIVNATLFSNSAIDMTDYGTPGMPKIVVVAGADHQVLYNTNDVVNATLLQEAIDTGLALTGIENPEISGSIVSVSPNPVKGTSVVNCFMTESAEVSLDLLNLNGSWIKNLYSGYLTKGNHEIPIDLLDEAGGIYFLKFSNKSQSQVIKVTVLK